MKKTIRLTESELIRLIKRVIKENANPQDPLSVIQECCEQNNVQIDLDTITSCASLAGKTPSQDQITACLTAIASKVLTLGPGVFGVGTCVMGKLGMPGGGGGGNKSGGGINFGGISLPGTMGGQFPAGGK